MNDKKEFKPYIPANKIMPEITVKSVLIGILLAIIAYQLIGTGIEWAMTQNFFVAMQDFRIGFPGMLIQLFGGYVVLKALAKV